jgi:polyribonucleotide nucleotidyltransferase
MFQTTTRTVDVGGKKITLETGRLARQAHGAVLITCNDTCVLVTACAQTDVREGVDFFPLTVEYIEKTYAAGKYPGGFYKREARPRDPEILVARLTDRSIRPLFPESFRYETQLIATVLSHDTETDSHTLAVTGASAALAISDIPWAGPLAGVRVGRVDGRLIANPTTTDLEKSDLNIFVSSTREAIMMVEGEARGLPESVMVEALLFAHEAAQPLIDAQLHLREAAGRPKRASAQEVVPADVAARVAEVGAARLTTALNITKKHERYAAIDEVKDAVVAESLAPWVDKAATDATVDLAAVKRDVKAAFSELKSRLMRMQVLREGRRIDGRRCDEVRPIAIEVGLLPRVHGSALFTRGETQGLATVTLGTTQDEQKVEDLTGEEYKRFLLHYNFPPFSVGEVKMLRAVSRREIGHGALAERALAGVVPDYDSFPYTIRVVSETLESNGSSSMAAVCGGCLALMDAGVPITGPVAGIAMGLIKEGDDTAILSDILGDEDHLGDMDFKVAGTAAGVTALQMDIKVAGVDRAILTRALEQARLGRMHILAKMKEALGAPRADLSRHAPRITTLKINPDRIRDVIGPGGKVIKDIIARTGVTIDVEDDGTVRIASSDADAAQRAVRIVHDLTMEPEVGRIYLGKVVSIKEFGAFVEIFPGTDGLVHISELSDKKVARVTDVLKEGDEILVKCLEIDRNGRIRLSRRQAMGATRADAVGSEA